MGRKSNLTREKLILTALLIVALVIFAVLPSPRQSDPGDLDSQTTPAVATDRSGATAPYAIQSSPLRPSGEATEATLPNHSSRR